MQKMKKKLLFPALLVLVLLASALFAFGASAETATNIAPTAMNGTLEGNYKVTADGAIAGTISVAAGKTLSVDLAGHKLTRATTISTEPVFSVGSGATLYLYSSVSGATITVSGKNSACLVSGGENANFYIGAYAGSKTPTAEYRGNFTYTGPQVAFSSGGSNTPAVVHIDGGTYVKNAGSSGGSYAFFRASKQALTVDAKNATFHFSWSGNVAYNAIVTVSNGQKNVNATFTDCKISSSAGASPFATESSYAGNVTLIGCELKNIYLTVPASTSQSSAITLGLGTRFNTTTGFDPETMTLSKATLASGLRVKLDTKNKDFPYVVVTTDTPDDPPPKEYEEVAPADFTGELYGTYHLTADGAMGGTVSVAAGQTLIVDLCGHKLTLSGANAFSVNGTLYLYSSVAGASIALSGSSSTQLVLVGDNAKAYVGAYDGKSDAPIAEYLDNFSYSGPSIAFGVGSDNYKGYIYIAGGTYTKNNGTSGGSRVFFRASKLNFQIEVKDATLNYSHYYATGGSEYWGLIGQFNAARGVSAVFERCKINSQKTIYPIANEKADFSGNVVFRDCELQNVALCPGSYTSNLASITLDLATRFNSTVNYNAALGDFAAKATYPGVTLADGLTFARTSDENFPYIVIPAFTAISSLEDRITFTVNAPEGFQITAVSGCTASSFTDGRAIFNLLPSECFETLYVTFNATLCETDYEGLTFPINLLDYAARLAKSPNPTAAALGEALATYVYYAAYRFNAEDAAAYYTASGYTPGDLAGVPAGETVHATTLIKGASFGILSKPEICFLLADSVGGNTKVTLTYTDKDGNEQVLVTTPNKHYSVTTATKTYRVVCFAIPAYDLTSAFTVSVEGDSKTLTYSLADYVSYGNDDADIAKALWLYADAAKANVDAAVVLTKIADNQDLTPAVIREIMAQILEYDTSDYSTTVATSAYQNADVSMYLTFKWGYAHPDQVKNAVLLFSNREDMAGASTVNVGCAEEASVRNLYTGTTVYWKVVATLFDGSTEESPVSSFTVKDGVRVLSFSGLSNIRDVGGHPTEYGVTIKEGLVYRSEELERMTAASKAQLLATLNVKTEIDFRNKNEVEAAAGGVYLGASELGPTVTYKNIGYPNYDQCFTSGFISGVKASFELFADWNNYPILFHCRHGADRTGTMAALLQAYLGCAENEIVADYEMTSGRTRPYYYEKSKVKYTMGGVLTKLRTDYGETIQEGAETYLRDTVGLNEMQLSNIYNIMMTDSAVFANPQEALTPEGGNLSIALILRDAGGVESVKVGEGKVTFTFDAETGTLTFPATGTGKTGTITLSDGEQLHFAY